MRTCSRADILRCAWKTTIFLGCGEVARMAAAWTGELMQERPLSAETLGLGVISTHVRWLLVVNEEAQQF